MNLHVIAREVIDALRDADPARSIDLEHRGEGEGSWPQRELVSLIEAAVSAAETGDVWVRTAGRELDMEILVEHVRRVLVLPMHATGEIQGTRLVVRFPRTLD